MAKQGPKQDKVLPLQPTQAVSHHSNHLRVPKCTELILTAGQTSILISKALIICSKTEM